MSRMNRRRFTWIATSGVASAALVACSGEAVEDDLTPTRIADVEGAPPTLAPNATPFSSEEEETGATPAEGAAAGGGEPITVTAEDSLSFDPSEFEVAPGQEIHVVNGGAMQHDFVVEGLDLATEMLNGGDEQTITVPEDAEPGDYVFFCSVTGHREAGMEGTMTIVETGAAGGEEEAPAEEEGGDSALAGKAATSATVSAFELGFDPSELTIAADTDVEITLTNDGQLQHDFVIEDTEFATELINGGESQTITVNLPAGEYTFFCSVPGHRESGMEGTLIVEGGGSAAAGTGEEEEAASEDSGAAASSGPVDASQPITVEALDALVFEPSEITVAPGQAILVVNVGSLQHDFVVDEWGLATSLLNGGTEEEIQVPGDVEVGQPYTFYCSVPGHAAAGMQGILTVVEAGGAASEGGDATAEAATPEETQATEPASDLDLAQDAIRVAALDSMRFAPSQFAAAPGQQIHLVNSGVLIHDIVVDEWELDSGAIGGGEETVFNIPDDAEVGAEVEFYCSVPGHRESGMVGTITIVEADVSAVGAATPVTESTPASPAAISEQATPITAEASPAAGATPAGTPTAGGGSGDAVTVTAVDIAFEPEELTIPADTDVEITLANEGVLQHDLTIEDTDFATELLDGGDSGSITVNLPSGEYVYFCSVPGHREAGMEGTLTVE